MVPFLGGDSLIFGPPRVGDTNPNPASTRAGSVRRLGGIHPLAMDGVLFFAHPLPCSKLKGKLFGTVFANSSVSYMGKKTQSPVFVKGQ